MKPHSNPPPPCEHQLMHDNARTIIVPQCRQPRNVLALAVELEQGRVCCHFGCR